MNMGTVTARLAVVLGALFLLGAAASFLIPSGAGGYECGNVIAPGFPEEETEAAIESASDTVDNLDPSVFGQMQGELAGSTMALAAAYGTCSANKTAEVRFATLNHGNRIVLKTSVADLRPNDQVGAYGVLRTPDNDKYVLRSFRADGQVRELALTRNGEARSCAARNLASNFDASKNVITLEVARSCLGNPTAVQWGVSVAAFKPNGDIVVDDARRNGNPPDGPEGTKVGDSVPFN